MNKHEITQEIQRIFDNNELEDLKKFIGKRQCLNNFNMSLMYIFHIVQSAGILTTTVAAGYNQVYLIWIGVALNILASLINIFEKNNNSMLKKLMIDIQKIKDGNYLGEGPLIEPDGDKSDKTDILINKVSGLVSTTLPEKNIISQITAKEQLLSNYTPLSI